MKVGNDCGLNKQPLFKDLTSLWLNTASISKPRRRGRLSEHGIELCDHRGESIGIQRGSLSPAVTQLETTELDPEQASCCSAFSPQHHGTWGCPQPHCFLLFHRDHQDHPLYNTKLSSGVLKTNVSAKSRHLLPPLSPAFI